MSATGQLNGRLRVVSRGRCQGADWAEITVCIIVTSVFDVPATVETDSPNVCNL